MPGISPILPFLPPKRWSPSPFCRCHGSEKNPVFSRVQGINLDSRVRRRLALWYNPRSRLGRSTQFLVILGAPQGEDPAAPLLGSPPPRRPRAGSRCPGDRRCCAAAAQQWPAGRGGAGTWAAIPGALPSPRGACACVRGCVRELGGDFTSARRWLRLDWKV